MKIMGTMTATTPVTLTAGAISEIKRLMGEEGFDTTQRLRVGVKGGGCSGMTYVLGFDKPEAEDENFEIEGIQCVMNKSRHRPPDAAATLFHCALQLLRLPALVAVEQNLIAGFGDLRFTVASLGFML